MASGTKLVLSFENDEGRTTTYTFNYAKSTATATQVKALMNGMITNKVIYENAPTVIKSAKTVTTSESVYDLSA